MPLPEGLMPTHAATGSMAGGSKGQQLTLLGAYQYIGGRSHRSTNQDWLPHRPQRQGNIGMARAKRPSGPLAMDEETGGRTVDGMLFDFAGVMRDVVQQRKPGLR